MSKVLTKEDKIYIRRICRYLGSLGMESGNLEIDLDSPIIDMDDLSLDQMTHFSNNYTAEIPEELKKIFEKILQYVVDNDLIKSPDVDSLNYERLELDIDCKTGEISVSHYYSYYDVEDSTSHSWEMDEDDDYLSEVFDAIVETQNETGNNDTELELRYNGSGDSGYIESDFENGLSVPSAVEDWCYRQLENVHGGWEINEGSQGTFYFDLLNNKIVLNHEYNTEESNNDTLWEEKF